MKEIPHTDVLQNTVTGFGGSLFSSLVSHNVGMEEGFSNLSVKNPEYIYNRFSFYNDDRHWGASISEFIYHLCITCL